MEVLGGFQYCGTEGPWGGCSLGHDRGALGEPVTDADAKTLRKRGIPTRSGFLLVRVVAVGLDD